MKALSVVYVLCTILMIGCQSSNIPQQVSNHQKSVIESKLEPQPTIPVEPKLASNIKIYWGKNRCLAEIKPGTLTITNDEGVIDQLDATKRAILVIGQNVLDGEPVWRILFIEMDRPKNQPETLKLYWVNKSFLDAVIDIGGFKHAVPNKKAPRQKKNPPTRRVPHETIKA